MLPGDIDHAFNDLFGINGAGGVIGVDNKKSLGLGSDLAADIIKVGIPVALFVAEIKDGLCSGDNGEIGPEGVAGGGDKYLIADLKRAVETIWATSLTPLPMNTSSGSIPSIPRLRS